MRRIVVLAVVLLGAAPLLPSTIGAPTAAAQIVGTVDDSVDASSTSTTSRCATPRCR